MPVYRCDWCGRFYSDPTPYGSACPSHVIEYNERLRVSIDSHNAKVATLRAEWAKAEGC